MKVLKDLRKKITILKPDKGRGVVLLKQEDYKICVEILFAYHNNFKCTHKDQTIMRLNTVQSYVNKLFNRGEIKEEQKKLIRPKAAQIGRVYGLPKIHKPFQHIPKFRLIIDTINTPYHGITKFLTSLLNPLALNEYVAKDSFEAAAKINLISLDDMSDEYTFVSFDVESLFTNVPLKKTIEIIFTRVCSEKKISKTFLLDACTKTTFSFNNELYEQIDGVSMGSPLGSLMANVIMTELKRVVVKDLFNKEYLKFYIRYMDDMLVLMIKKRCSHSSTSTYWFS